MLTIESFILTEEDCIAILREIKWPNGITCPSCSSKGIIRYGNYGLYQKYLCKGCGYVFNDKTGTIFYRSRVPLKVWFFVAFMLQLNISILELTKTFNMYYDTLYKLVKKLKKSGYLNIINKKVKEKMMLKMTHII
ncbi:MAG: transposase [Nitrososphaerales archaeon]